MNNDATFYVGQKAFIRKGNEILVLKSPLAGVDFAGGKIQENESNLEKSLQREVFEETGLKIKVGKPCMTWIGMFPKKHALAGKKVFLVGYHCTYISGKVRLSHEHDACMWVSKKTFKKVKDNTTYFKILEKYFKEYN